MLNKLKARYYLLTLVFCFFYTSCTKYESEIENGQILVLLLSGANFLQLADDPYTLTTIFTNEKGAADLDGVGDNASFVSLAAIQYFNNTLYLMDNSRKIFPKLKTFNLTSKEIITIGSLNTNNKNITDMALTSDGHFFISNDKIFFYSSFQDIATGTPTQTVSFNNVPGDYFNFSRIKVDTIRKNLFILNKCKIYKLPYTNLPQTVTLSTPFFTYPGCGFNFGNNINIINFLVDSNEILYVSQNNFIQKNSSSSSLNTIYSNDTLQSFTNLNIAINRNEIFFIGENINVNGFRITGNKKRLYKINLSTLRINLLAGGSTSLVNLDSRDGIGTFSGFRETSYMTFDPLGNLYFIDNFLDYRINNSILVQKIRRASKL